jgi:hypothetical protein
MKNLFTALSIAQSEFPPIRKSTTVKVKTTSGEFTYTYATLDEIIDAIRPALQANGLAFSQGASSIDGAPHICTVILHSSGEALHTGHVPLVTKKKLGASGQDVSGPQEMGGGLTYARRYSLSLAFGIASEDDDDANAGEDHHAERKYNARKESAPPAPEPMRTPVPSRSEAAALVEKVIRSQSGGGIGAQPPEDTTPNVHPNEINWHVAPDSWDALWQLCLFRVGSADDAEGLFQEITRGDKPGPQGTVFPGYKSPKFIKDEFKTESHSWKWVKAFKKLKDHPVFGAGATQDANEEAPF